MPDAPRPKRTNRAQPDVQNLLPTVEQQQHSAELAEAAAQEQPQAVTGQAVGLVSAMTVHEFRREIDNLFPKADLADMLHQLQGNMARFSDHVQQGKYPVRLSCQIPPQTLLCLQHVLRYLWPSRR
jgi:hypothetical protein